MPESRAHSAMQETFRWVSGHADVWRVFADADALSSVVTGLADPWRGVGVTKVLGIESRGFLLGAATAVHLRAGFVAVRKTDGLLPGPKLTVEARPDYRQRRHVLRMQTVLGSTDRVLLVDDWAQRGSQALAARRLVEAAGATFLGVSLLVDQLSPASRAALVAVTSVVTADELGPPTQ